MIMLGESETKPSTDSKRMANGWVKDVKRIGEGQILWKESFFERQLNFSAVAQFSRNNFSPDEYRLIFFYMYI